MTINLENFGQVQHLVEGGVRGGGGGGGVGFLVLNSLKGLFCMRIKLYMYVSIVLYRCTCANMFNIWQK